MSKLVNLVVVCSICAVAQSPDWRSAVQAKLSSQYTLTKLSNKSTILVPGSVVVLKKDNLGLWATTSSIAPPTNAYADDVIKPELAALLARKVREGSARVFAAGEKLFLTGLEIKSDGVVLEILGDAEGGRYWGTLRFPFAKGSQPSPAQIVETVAGVLEPEGAQKEDRAVPMASTSPDRHAPAPSGAVGQPLDVSALDVAGVRLGMTPEQAIEALKRFDSWPVLAKRYYTSSIVVDRRGENIFAGVLGSTADCEQTKG